MDNRTQLRRLGLFDAKVPRYTSYPPATRFAGGVTAEDHGDWISQIPEGTKLSFYAHIPFCRRLCWFCACRTQGVRSDAPVIAYVETLLSEIALLKTRLPKGVTLGRLHWGGGTPTLLTPDLMKKVADAFQDLIPWEADAEFSVEIDPNEVDADRIKALAVAGMNRASIGVQDFDDEIQQVIGRIQSYETTRDTVAALRDVGVHSLNADILYGLPHQSQLRMSDSVQKLLSLSPDRVALYGYAHVPWMAKRQCMIPTDTLPTPEERLALFETARKLFSWDGYQEIGIDHFARPNDSLGKAARSGHLRRNFQGYTDDRCDVLIGLGASAISRGLHGYSQNASSTADYTRAIRAGQLATARGHVFTQDDHLRGRLIEALMCDFHINLSEIVETLGTSPERLNVLFQKAVKAFPGMLTITEDGLTILPEGRPLTRMIARAFDAYDMAEGSHSLAT